MFNLNHLKVSCFFLLALTIQVSPAAEPEFYGSLGQARVSSYSNTQKVASKYNACEGLREIEGFGTKIAPYYQSANQYIFINGDAAKALFYSLARNPEALKKWTNPDMKISYHTLSMKFVEDFAGLHNTCCIKQRERTAPIFGDSYYADKDFICHIMMNVPSAALEASHKDLEG